MEPSNEDMVFAKNESEEDDFTANSLGRLPGDVRKLDEGNCVQDLDGLGLGQRPDDPILIEENVCTSDNSGHVAAGSEDDANKLKCTPPAEEPPVCLDMNNLETKRDILCAKDLSETPLHKNERSYRSVTSPRLRIVPLCAGPAEAQENSPRPSREDTGDTIVVECGTSDRGSESSDDSDDEEYVEEPQRLTKRR